MWITHTPFSIFPMQNENTVLNFMEPKYWIKMNWVDDNVNMNLNIDQDIQHGWIFLCIEPVFMCCGVVVGNPKEKGWLCIFKNPDAKTHRIAVGYHINWKEHHSINGILAKICFALRSRIFLNPEGCAMYSSFMIISCTWVMLLRWFVQYCERPLMSHNSAHTRFP